MSFDARSIIAQVREGHAPSGAAMGWFAQGLADHTVSDAQAAAFAMAVCLKGLPFDSRVDLTCAMRDSGPVLHWDFDGPVLDKHSTGGVGDCVSLVLAPLLASAGVFVPMISGRGLGHTGGTLDKLQAIPGLSVQVEKPQFDRLLKEVGCAIVSAGAALAPADKRLYAIRDVTSTVDSLDLITASILSKKLAAGLDGLILDVKCGSGAFMKTPDQARVLAQSLVRTAGQAGCNTIALISDMNQPLAPALGNALELVEVMQVLCEGKAGRLRELTLQLGAELLCANRLFTSFEAAQEDLANRLDSGQAAEKFGQMVALMGGPLGFVDNWQRFLPEAPVIREIYAAREGYITAWDSEALGLSVVQLGGGRQVESDIIDPSVGLSDVLPIGSKVIAGMPVARVHANRVGLADKIGETVRNALSMAEIALPAAPLVLERVG